MNERPARADLPEVIFAELAAGIRYKTGLGEKGLYRQSELNERFYEGDQWHGAACGSDRPLVRHNVIRRIGEYKISAVGAATPAVNFTADGVAVTAPQQERVRVLRAQAANGEDLGEVSDADYTDLCMAALTDYYRVTAERVGLNLCFDRVLHDAYRTGTGVLYTYWDDTVPTGQYADAARRVPVYGDVSCEVLDIRNVYFGDPTREDVQDQPYILLCQYRRLDDVRRLAARYGADDATLAAIKPEHDSEGNGDKVLLVTKLYKEYDGMTPTLKAVQVCRGVTVRPAWEMGVRLYPVTVFRWDTRPDCAYGDSEVTWLIPNQIAVNRMLSASVWAVLMQGMPTLLVNGDVVQGPVTNDPGQVIRVFGSGDDVRNALYYVDPPAFSASLDNTAERLIADTLAASGATAAALGDVTPQNTSAIVAVREAAMLPLQTVQNRFYAFCEQTARVFAEFFVTAYGRRGLRLEEENGVWYLPFDGDRLRDLVIRARVDVGASTVWSESQSIVTLDRLLEAGVLTPRQYLKRLPKGVVPDVEGLLRELNGEVIV